LVAWVVLPDHCHMLLSAPHESIPNAMIRMKMSFGQLYRRTHGVMRGRIWQYRYWDHIVRDELDFENHLAYIHYNPVKHHLSKMPIDYPHSSFSWFVDNGWYARDWTLASRDDADGDYGE
jgi:putative transposase